jgi:hypothetical protein
VSGYGTGADNVVITWGDLGMRLGYVVRSSRLDRIPRPVFGRVLPGGCDLGNP